MFIRVVLLLFVLLHHLGCASSGIAVRPSYRGETTVSSRQSSKKNAEKSSERATQNTPRNSEGSSSKDSNSPNIKNIERVAHKYIGVRYKYGGTTTKGFDCSGYVWRVYQDMGIDFSRSSSKAYYQKGKKISKSKAGKGDLVFFKERGKINHVGIYLGADRFVHASSSRGVIESSLTNSYWKPRIAGFRRYF